MHEFKDFLNSVPGLSLHSPTIPGSGEKVLDFGNEIFDDDLDLELPCSDLLHELAILTREHGELGDGKNLDESDIFILGPVEKSPPITITNTLTFVVERYWMDIRDGFRITSRGRLFVKGAHTRYQILHNWIKKHAAIYGEVELSKVNDKWLKGFIHFLHHQNLSLNTVAGYVDNMHALFGNLSTEVLDLPKLTVRVHPEATHSVYNSEEELDMLLNFSFSHEALSIARDIFVMQSYLGFRVGTLQKFLREPQLFLLKEKDRWLIQIRTNKTGYIVTVPVKSLVLEILQRWSYSFEPAYYERYYNTLIKMMALEANLIQIVPSTMTYGNKRKEFRDEKWELMASHTARRNFATNAFLAFVPVENIMWVTGHTTREAFLKYIRCDSLANAIAMLKHTFFK